MRNLVQRNAALAGGASGGFVFRDFHQQRFVVQPDAGVLLG